VDDEIIWDIIQSKLIPLATDLESWLSREGHDPRHG